MPDHHRTRTVKVSFLAFLCAAALVRAEIGDPQLSTDHRWYPGEGAISQFERLFRHQARLYREVVGVVPQSDEDKALASWLWRNTHYWHGEEGAQNIWGKGFARGGDFRTREYWTGLFAHGFGLCGTTHSQWTAEIEHLLGHGRARGVGVDGHNSFEVFLHGDAYGEGRWALLDHDLSTVLFGSTPTRLLSIAEVQQAGRGVTRDSYPETRKRGWLPVGLHADDGNVFSRYVTAEYLPGYAGPPPIVHLRRGERLTRYFQPGLEDGHTFVFWGRNYKTTKIPGPERALTWVNQPDKMFRSARGAGFLAGRARYANAVYEYTPDFDSHDYQEAVISESDRHVTFAFYTPYIIAATPPNDTAWGIYDKGGRNGLIVRGDLAERIEISVDQGQSWANGVMLNGAVDLTDHVKGYRQYWLRLNTGAAQLRRAKLMIRTVCQANVSVFPHLRDNGSSIEFACAGTAVLSAGPTRAQAQAHVIGGSFDSREVTLELRAPKQRRVKAIYAAAHWASGNPPDSRARYQTDYSLDTGKTWQSVVKDWDVPRRGEEPSDFWSQSFSYGFVDVSDRAVTNAVQIRFHNNAGKKVLRAEAHLVYETAPPDPVDVTYAWVDDRGAQTHTHQVTSGGARAWNVPTSTGVQMKSVSIEPAAYRVRVR